MTGERMPHLEIAVHEDDLEIYEDFSEIIDTIALSIEDAPTCSESIDIAARIVKNMLDDGYSFFWRGIRKEPPAILRPAAPQDGPIVQPAATTWRNARKAVPKP